MPITGSVARGSSNEATAALDECWATTPRCHCTPRWAATAIAHQAQPQRDVVYLFHPPQRGDIIVFDPPTNSDKPYIKRVIGLPGDTIAVHEDHFVHVNGRAIQEDYIAAAPRQVYPLGGGEYTVPAGMIFVMGDNRNNSQDSRIFGAVSFDSVIGKAIVSYWPLDGFGLIPHQRYAAALEGR